MQRLTTRSAALAKSAPTASSFCTTTLFHDCVSFDCDSHLLRPTYKMKAATAWSSALPCSHIHSLETPPSLNLFRSTREAVSDTETLSARVDLIYLHALYDSKF
jgi:hypothetical protein